MAETDGIDEALEGTLRVALTAAARVAEQLVRQRETELRRAEADSMQAAREYRSRLEAERAAARAALRGVGRPEWWDRAGVEEITGAYGTAREWAQVDPEIADVEQTIREQAQLRLELDLAAPPAPTEYQLAEAWARQEEPELYEAHIKSYENADTSNGRDSAERELIRAHRDAIAKAEAERARTAAATAETVAAGAAADRADAATPYDSAERRQEMAEHLAEVTAPEVVEARVRADVSQARPATEAVQTAAGRSPRARRSRLAGSRNRQRGLVR